jgi:hypothetical protein
LAPRATRTFALLIVLVTLFSSQSVFAQSDWIDRTVVTQYVDNLLDSYNALVNLHYGYYPNSAVLNRFRLYHAVGYSFNVTVMKFNSTTTAFVAFVFVPIMSASPLIVIDNNDTFIHFQFPNLPKSLEPAMSALLKPNNTLGIEQVQGTSVGPNGTRLAQRIWIANATTMFDNPMTSSADAATYMFKGDQAGYNQDLARSQTTTSPQPVINPSSCGMFEPICSLPVTWVGLAGLLGFIAYIFRTTIIDLFGSWKEFFVFVVDKKERKPLWNNAKQVLSRRKNRGKEQENEDSKTKSSDHKPSKRGSSKP